MQKGRQIISLGVMALSLIVSLLSCSGTKYVGEEQLLLTHTRVVSDSPGYNVSGLSAYLVQKPNTKWFSSLKVPLAIYSLSGSDTTKAINRRLRNWGEAPVILDSTSTQRSCNNLTRAVQNDGYLNAEVLPEYLVSGKKVTTVYHVIPGERYTLRNMRYLIADRVIDSLFQAHGVLEKGLQEGNPFSVNELYAERNRLTQWLTEQGYLYFNKEAITFVADSSRQGRFVDVTMNIGLYRSSSSESLHEHPRYYIRNVIYETIGNQALKLRPRVLDVNTLVKPGALYRASDIQKTYNRFARMQAIRSTNIHLVPVQHGDSISQREVDAKVQISRRKTHSIQLQPEGTNTAGDFGAAISVTYENRNIFHGSELLSLQARGAFEAIRNLEGYSASNYEEYGAEAKLQFPELIFPGLSREYHRTHSATSELAISYNRQNRPEFHRRVFTGAWRYRWNSGASRISHKLDLIDLNYISMPWISSTFKHDYLDSESNRNAILRYNYEDLFIMKIGYGISYSDGKNIVKLNVETAGNILYGLSHVFRFPENDHGQYKVARVAFAQFAKFDADYTRLFKLDYRNTLALHGRIGVAVPYGNSSILPFEKRYFAGGANSVRGWSVRSLGPGHFHSTDGKIDFINQTGDMKIDLNAELRTNLFWKFQGALFIDAGNIWTLRNYPEQPGGQFRIQNILTEMAVAYGLGLRMNFDYFILRLDMGMKAVNPDYANSKEHFPIANPKFSRDYALHFAVGLPF